MTLGLFEVTDENDGSLLAMIHGTRMSSMVVNDASMAIGSHEPDGPTVGLHYVMCSSRMESKGSRNEDIEGIHYSNWKRERG